MNKLNFGKTSLAKGTATSNMALLHKLRIILPGN